MDTSLISFLTGYLRGRQQRRLEEEEERQRAEERSLRLAQFLEAQKEREQQERFRQAQLDISMRQLDISERHQAMLERHYELQNEIQRIQMEMQREENEMRRQEHAWRMQGLQLSLLDTTVNLFGQPDRALGFLKKSPVPAVAQWVSSLEAEGLKAVAKMKALPVLMNMANVWNSDKMPSDKALSAMMKSYGLEGVFSLDEVRGLMKLRTENVAGALSAEMRMFAQKKAIEYEYDRKLLAQRLAAEATLQRLREKSENERVLGVLSYIRNPATFITAISSQMDAGAITKAIGDGEGDITKMVVGLGLPSELATFYSTTALGIMAHTPPTEPVGMATAVATDVFTKRIKNPTFRQKTLQGAEQFFTLLYNKKPSQKEIHNFIRNYIYESTGDKDIANKLSFQLLTGSTPSVIKSAK